MAILDNYECEGQINLNDYAETKFPVLIRGNDAYCPRCQCIVNDDTKSGICHFCGLKLYFAPYHRANKEDK